MACLIESIYDSYWLPKKNKKKFIVPLIIIEVIIKEWEERRFRSMEPKDIGKKIYTVVFMGRIQYEMFATFIFMKYIVTEYKSKDLRVICIYFLSGHWYKISYILM